MRLRHHRQHEDDSETGIDLAPMLDFVLNLLIFFIITAVFVKEVGIPAGRPSNKQQKVETKKDNTPILVTISATGEIGMDRRIIDMRAVRANIERFHAEKPDAPVIVAAHSEAPTGILVQVMDQARQGGVENVSIAASGGQ